MPKVEQSEIKKIIISGMPLPIFISFRVKKIYLEGNMTQYCILNTVFYLISCHTLSAFSYIIFYYCELFYKNQFHKACIINV